MAAAARYVAEQAVQLHGGIGMTIDYKVGHYFKRITALESLFGDLDHHLAAVSKPGGFRPGSADVSSARSTVGQRGRGVSFGRRPCCALGIAPASLNAA